MATAKVVHTPQRQLTEGNITKTKQVVEAGVHTKTRKLGWGSRPVGNEAGGDYWALGRSLALDYG